MANFNKVILMGNLTRDPELKFLPSGTALCNFGLAVNNEYKDKDGEWKEDVCFIDVAVFGKPAESCSEYLEKGRPVLVDGRLGFSQWETDDGQKRSKHNVVANSVQFLGGKQDE